VAAKTSEGGTLLTPSLLTQAATLRANLAAVLERTRDLLWCSRQRRRGGAPLGRPIGGASDHVEDAAVVLTMILASTASARAAASAVSSPACPRT